ncbi:hypothetical protein VTJ83DRAFT_5358 [Remersonia thermophila]|uniref:Fumarylacetoacetase n=1 Tax=Remersonia thermophila TaxID=72144 RepID=A0ABR4D6L6_9PEZI
MLATGTWVEMDPLCPFSLANLPLAIATTPGQSEPHVVSAIGPYIIELPALIDSLGEVDYADLVRYGDRRRLAAALSAGSLLDLAALGQDVPRRLRSALQELLSDATSFPHVLRDNPAARARVLAPAEQARFRMPVAVADYTDFYAGYHHARAVGAMFRGADKALMPNYLHLPVGYHGRSSSVVLSGTPVRRPVGQILAAGPTPVTAPTRKLDLELELGCIIARGSGLGERVPVDEAGAYILGYVLLNDWSARDVQKWEYVPLGPFNGKNFATTISPWVVTPDALEPYRTRPSVELGVEPQPYLKQAREDRVFDIQLEVDLTTAEGVTVPISRTSSRHLVWSFDQMVAHHTLGGCPLRGGDLLGSGTISGPGGPCEAGCLLEATLDGSKPIKVQSDGKTVTRSYLEDGDTITVRGFCGPEGARVGFGECAGRIEAARWP